MFGEVGSVPQRHDPPLLVTEGSRPPLLSRGGALECGKLEDLAQRTADLVLTKSRKYQVEKHPKRM